MFYEQVYEDLEVGWIVGWVVCSRMFNVGVDV
jgi:hypothetical protein